jgi:hypothetical protein
VIVALLVLIILILLFGAGVLKGWIANVATMGCGFISICLALIWLGSFFGEHGFMYVVFAIGVIALVLGIIGKIMEASPPAPPIQRHAPASSPRPRPIPKPSPPPEPPAVEKVWGWYAHDISLRFSAEARDKARKLYDAGDAHNLDRFCREERARLR